jgi:hypothetical protein
MNQSITNVTSHFTPAASLAAVGVLLQQLKVFEPIEQGVHIKQKTIKYSPTQKLFDSFITLLAGAHGMVEMNTLLRADPTLQAAFGREACAEQSVAQQTLDACTAENVTQMEQAMNQIVRQQSQAFRHNYQQGWQILDVDLSGWLCGKQAAFATKGYFAGAPRNRRGRQVGRVLASQYQEVVVDRLFAGSRQLGASLQELIQAAQETLQLDEAQRARCVVRFDAGGGSLSNFNALLEQGYELVGKICSTQQARLLAKTVQEWVTDTQVPERQMGWVTQEPEGFVKPVRRVAVRCKKANGTWGIGVLTCSLSSEAIVHLAPRGETKEDHAVLRALVALYDQRGGGIETSFQGDKQGLGLTKRNKKRFEAQQVLLLLGSLAHNVVVWARGWLTSQQQETGTPPVLLHYGILRMVRDVFHISGSLSFDASGKVVQILLNQDAFLAHLILPSLRHLLFPMHVAISLGKN